MGIKKKSYPKADRNCTKCPTHFQFHQGSFLLGTPMAVPLPYLLLLVMSVGGASSPRRFSAASALCPRQDLTLPDAAVRSQCPLWNGRPLVLEVTGKTLDKDLGNVLKNAFYSVLFYASWCPFSQAIRPTFDALSTMFPLIRHLAVEESSAVPSLLSRYGVHSFPSILLMNGTTRVLYHGSKDLNSLVLLYKSVTGLEPAAADLSVDQYIEFGNKDSIWTWNSSPTEYLTREPYLAFSFLFLLFRAFLYISPWILPMLRAGWFTYVWHANRGIFGEWSQLPWRALRINDAKRLWSRLGLSNRARNIQKGANNARAWASSLTSVSLGEPSSSRTLVGS